VHLSFCRIGDSNDEHGVPDMRGRFMTAPVVLAPKLDLAAATDLMTTLKTFKEDEVVLDLSEVKHLGALCLQVLLSAATSAISENRKITLANVSDRVIDQMRLMGMTPESIERGRQ
jgi:chemotaxis protein CheX